LKNTLLVILLLFLAGCTSKGLYGFLQPSSLSCYELPMQQRDGCFKHIDRLMTYEEYIKARERL